MKPKSLQTMTKTKVSPKVVFGVIVLIGLIAGSLIVTSMIPGTNLLGATSPKPPGLNGWCYTGHSGSHMSKIACISLGTDNNPNTNWYAYCPDLVNQPPRNADNCNSSYADMQLSPRMLQVQESRETVINAVNDGDFTAADSILLDEYMIPVQLGLECTIYFPSISNVDPTKKDYESFGVKGTAQFLGILGKLFSHMVSKADNNCELFPAGCQITDSLRRCTCNTDPKTSAHCCGQAFDLACDGWQPYCDTNPATNALVSKIVGKIAGAGPVNVLRECTRQEKKNQANGGCSDGGSVPVIHVDIKSHGNPNEPCVFEDCNFNVCK